MGSIQVSHVGWRRPGGAELLRDVSFGVGNGERVALVGANGVGKSNVLEALGVLGAAANGVVDDESLLRRGVRAGLPRFCGGLAGYFGYDAVRYIERKLEHSCPPDTLGNPDILLLLCEELAVIDNLSGKLYLIVYADPSVPEAFNNANKRLRSLQAQLKYSVSAPSVARSQSFPVEREFDKGAYIKAVEEAKEMIAAGEFMQVQVGQRLKKRYAESPLSLYRALRSLNPSPYMYFYDFGDFQVVGASPEILVREEKITSAVDGVQSTKHMVTIRPLAGTRPRGATPELDKAAEVELIGDPKERAEHVMLIDLARNDIGRIAQIGFEQLAGEVGQVGAVARCAHDAAQLAEKAGQWRPGLQNRDLGGRLDLRSAA